MNVDLGGASTLGKKPKQEDCYLGCRLREHRRHLDRDLPQVVSMAVLCDGMGGAGDGDFCSQRVVQAFADAFAASGSFIDAWKPRLLMALYASNAALHDAKERYRELSPDAGCSLVAAAVCGDRLHFVSVGDSLVYLFRRIENDQNGNYSCTLLNHRNIEWHKLSGNPVVDTVVSEVEAENLLQNPEPEVRLVDRLSSAIQGRGIPYAELNEDEEGTLLMPGDFVVIASDGVDRALPEGYMSYLAQCCDDPVYSAQNLANDIISKVDEKGDPHGDNSSCVVFKCD